jgi:hypothetical protein
MALLYAASMARRGILLGERGCGRQILRADADPHTKDEIDVHPPRGDHKQ